MNVIAPHFVALRFPAEQRVLRVAVLVDLMQSAQAGGHVLEVALPFTSREEVGLSRDGDELVIQVGGFRRTLVLPRALVDVPTTGAKMEDGILHIEFSTRSKAANGGGRR